MLTAQAKPTRKVNGFPLLVEAYQGCDKCGVLCDEENHQLLDSRTVETYQQLALFLGQCQRMADAGERVALFVDGKPEMLYTPKGERGNL